MAIIKCPSCGNSVSDKETKCPMCDSILDTKVYCPKCKSANTTLNIESANAVKASIIYSLFGAFAGKKASEDRIMYVCNDCGKKFKNKQ